MNHQCQECCICYNNFPASYPVLSCGHKVHPKCMRIWNKSCPLCRQVVKIIPTTRCLLTHTHIYDGLETMLGPFQDNCALWRSYPDKRTPELINQIWIANCKLASFIWDNRIVMRRNERLIINIKNRLPKILDAVITMKNNNWVGIKQNKKDIKHLKYILNRI